VFALLRSVTAAGLGSAPTAGSATSGGLTLHHLALLMSSYQRSLAQGGLAQSGLLPLPPPHALQPQSAAPHAEGATAAASLDPLIAPFLASLFYPVAAATTATALSQRPQPQSLASAEPLLQPQPAAK
jgi:hypothetical protein